MRIDVHVHFHDENELRADLAKISHQIHQLKESTTMNSAELAQALNDLVAQENKAKAEIVQKIADLEAAIAAGSSTTPEVDAALAALKAAVQGVDDIVPDAPAP